MMTALPLILLLQFVPPPFGPIMAARLLGTAPAAAPAAAAAPAEDCHCGVPASPRGPR